MQTSPHEQLIGQIEKLKLETVALRRGIRAVFGNQRFADSARALFDQCRQALGVTTGLVVLLSDNGGDIEVVFMETGATPRPDPLQLPIPVEGLGMAAFDQVRVMFENHFRTSRWITQLPKGQPVPENVLFAPLLIEDRAVGLFAVADKPGEFTGPDADLAAAFADLTALALAGARCAEQRLTCERLVSGSQAELSAIYENTPVMMLLVDSDQRIRKANRLALQLSGRTDEEVIGLRGGEALQCIHALSQVKGCGFGPDCRHCKVRRTIVESLDSGRGFDRVEADLSFSINGTQKECTVLLSTTPMRIDDKPMVLVSIMDVTPYKQAQQALRKSEERLTQAQKMEALGTLAGGIAHDFNNILFPLVGFAEMLKADLAEQSPLQDHVDEILHAALRSRELVQQILSFSHKTAPKARIVSIQAIVKEAIKLIRAAIPATIKLQQCIVPDCAPVNADPTQIHQIIMNLATNAYHAMEEKGGTLEVALEEVPMGPDGPNEAQLPPGRYVCLSISDSGAGISGEIMDKIFDPYFTTKDEDKGTGLGLSVVRGIVHGHGGDIQIQSTPGQGTTCRVFLPVIAPEDGLDLDEEEIPYPGGSERLMIVDDEAAIIRMLGNMLKRLGYQVTAHTSSVAALDAFQAAPDRFDLVITDMTMPDVTGIKLARHIKRTNPDLPVIICTGYSERLDAAGAKALGMEGYLMKPVTIREMAETVRRVLDQRRKG